jgi:hypothetical protein
VFQGRSYATFSYTTSTKKINFFTMLDACCLECGYKVVKLAGIFNSTGTKSQKVIQF